MHNLLHSIANELAIKAGDGMMYKLREYKAREVNRPVYSVILKHWSKKRGTHVFTIDASLTQRSF